MENLKNKQILMIAPKFYEYEKVIKKHLEELGANVFLVYENLDRFSLLFRIIYVYFRGLKEKAILHYYERNIRDIPDSLDYVFIIRGSSITNEVMHFLRNKFCFAKFIQYQWDSIESNENAANLLVWCDRSYTFDFEDAEDNRWIYRPLFCSKSPLYNKDIDVSFIGTLHTDRLKILKKVVEICEKNKYSNFLYLYSNRIIYMKKKYLERDKRYMGLSDKMIKFKALSLGETSAIYARTKVIVDYTAEQTGLSMRTIESLCNGCKLVTNNSYIVNTDLYSPKNVYVYSGLETDFSEKFVKDEFEKLEEAIRNKYTLNSWINDIFQIMETSK